MLRGRKPGDGALLGQEVKPSCGTGNPLYHDAVIFLSTSEMVGMAVIMCKLLGSPLFLPWDSAVAIRVKVPNSFRSRLAGTLFGSPKNFMGDTFLLELLS